MADLKLKSAEQLSFKILGKPAEVGHLIQRIRAYVASWNANAEPFVWTAGAEDIIAKARVVQTNVRKLVQNNST